jgi:putative spermidine/putrescine transport system ATP-binding protein
MLLLTESGAISDARAAGATGSPEPNSHAVAISEVTHKYGSFVAVRNVTLQIRAGEIVALLGPSGCGKTTLLRIIAGFVQQTSGSVMVDGRPIDDLPANMRNIGIVFQSYALFPHMTVAENVAYGLRARHRPREEMRCLSRKEGLNTTPTTTATNCRSGRRSMGRPI